MARLIDINEHEFAYKLTRREALDLVCMLAGVLADAPGAGIPGFMVLIDGKQKRVFISADDK